MRVSVVIPCWNGQGFLVPCLDSLAGQSFDDFETIVVDNGSSDSSVALVKRRYPGVRLIELPRNVGFARACNIGFREARGELVALLNQDTEVDRDWLAEMVRALDAAPEAGFCAPKILMDEGKLIDSAGHVVSKKSVVMDRGYGEVDQGQYDEPCYVFGACGAAALYRGKMLEELGGFDEDFFLLMEDVDLNFRAQLLGYDCLYVPSARVKHKRGSSRVYVGLSNLYLGSRNTIYCLIKDLPLTLLIKKLPSYFRLLHRFWMEMTIKGDLKAVVMEQFVIFRQLGKLLRKRWEIQAQARVSSRELEGRSLPRPTKR